jgi:hypothetical protein
LPCDGLRRTIRNASSRPEYDPTCIRAPSTGGVESAWRGAERLSFQELRSWSKITLPSCYTLARISSWQNPQVLPGSGKYQALSPILHEKARRCWAACEALSLGYGGISLVAAATGLSRPTIRRGVSEIQASNLTREDSHPEDLRIRRAGGGRHALAQADPRLLHDLRLYLHGVGLDRPRPSGFLGGLPLATLRRNPTHTRIESHGVTGQILPSCGIASEHRSCGMTIVG